MRSVKVISIFVFVNLFFVGALGYNAFNNIRDCKQYNTVIGYDGPLQYFPMANFQNVRNTGHSKVFKIAILGPNDGIMRFGKYQFPYDQDVIEIVLGGWSNTRSAGRRQRRTSTNRATNTVLIEVQTPHLMSQFQPLMFVLEVYNDGRVEVRLDGQPQPFLSFHDNHRIPINYLAFTKWDKNLIYFYDCPL